MPHVATLRLRLNQRRQRRVSVSGRSSSLSAGKVREGGKRETRPARQVFRERVQPGNEEIEEEEKEVAAAPIASPPATYWTAWDGEIPANGDSLEVVTQKNERTFQESKAESWRRVFPAIPSFFHTFHAPAA